MAQVRHLDITNTSNPPVLLTSVPVNLGQDYAFQTVRWTFTAADVGNAAGQTADTQSNPTTGFLFAQVKGAVFKHVISLSLIKAAAATNVTMFNYFTVGDVATPGVVRIGYRIVNTKLGGGVVQSSLYILDSGTAADAASNIVAGDVLAVSFELGNT
jgi:hypothetical protein